MSEFNNDLEMTNSLTILPFDEYIPSKNNKTDKKKMSTKKKNTIALL